jgi:serine-type D-Ala-D-Ala carboxypeptidase/endopeptidase
VPSLSNRRFAAWSVGACLMTSISAHAGVLPERVEKAAQERVEAGTYRTLVFAIVDGDKSEVVAFGKLENGEAPDGDTVYEIGSITKTFTATLLAEAVLAGRVTLDTPVARLLPDFKVPSRGGREITLGELAMQNSGLPRLPSNSLPKDPTNPYADYDAAKLKTFLAGYELPRDPGATYEYSNLGFGLLGYALAQASDTTYGAMTAEDIFRPLGMSMSGAALTDAMRAHLAPGHDASRNSVRAWDFDALAGAGAVKSTADDMLRYLRANMGIGASPVVAATQFAQQPRGNAMRAMRIGLAWMTTPSGIVWHSGETGGYASFIGFTADRRHGVVILTDTGVTADDLGFAALDAGAEIAPAQKAIDLPAAALDDYVGTYKLADNFLLEVFASGDALLAQATGQGAVPIFPSAPNEFFARIAGISLSFMRGANGMVDGLVLHQNGDHRAPRLSAAELPPEPKEITLDAAVLGDYVGRYQFDFGMFDVVLKREALEVHLTGQPPLPVFASAKDKFFYKAVDAQLDFQRDAGGKIVAVVLHQNGRDMRAQRMADR